jgi:hypothetical protein
MPQEVEVEFFHSQNLVLGTKYKLVVSDHGQFIPTKNVCILSRRGGWYSRQEIFIDKSDPLAINFNAVIFLLKTESTVITNHFVNLVNNNAAVNNPLRGHRADVTE